MLNERISIIKERNCDLKIHRRNCKERFRKIFAYNKVVVCELNELLYLTEIVQ